MNNICNSQNNNNECQKAKNEEQVAKTERDKIINLVRDQNSKYYNSFGNKLRDLQDQLYNISGGSRILRINLERTISLELRGNRGKLRII